MNWPHYSLLYLYITRHVPVLSVPPCYTVFSQAVVMTTVCSSTPLQCTRWGVVSVSTCSLVCHYNLENVKWLWKLLCLRNYSIWGKIHGQPRVCSASVQQKSDIPLHPTSGSVKIFEKNFHATLTQCTVPGIVLGVVVNIYHDPVSLLMKPLLMPHSYTELVMIIRPANVLRLGFIGIRIMIHTQIQTTCEYGLTVWIFTFWLLVNISLYAPMNVK